MNAEIWVYEVTEQFKERKLRDSYTSTFQKPDSLLCSTVNLAVKHITMTAASVTLVTSSGLPTCSTALIFRPT